MVPIYTFPQIWKKLFLNSGTCVLHSVHNFGPWSSPRSSPRVQSPGFVPSPFLSITSLLQFSGPADSDLIISISIMKFFEELFMNYTYTMGKIIMPLESTFPCECAGYNLDCPQLPCKCVNKQDCPQAQPLCAPGETKIEFVRGGVVRAWVTWEAYLGDIVHEVFQVVIKSATSAVEPTDDVAKLKALKEKWPNTRTMIQDQFMKREKRKGKAAVFDLLTERDAWRVLLDEYVDKAVNTISPVFASRGNQRGINETFQSLFCSKSGPFPPVSKKIVYLAGHPFQFKYVDCRGETDVEIGNETTLCDILRLYYGLRCAFTHGSVEKTLKCGALADFPEKPIQLIVKESEVHERAVVEHSFVELYEKIKSQGKEAEVTLNDLKNMISFLKQCASKLTVIMSDWLVEMGIQE